MNLPKNLSFVDVETTGLRAGYDRIIDIAIIRAGLNPQTEKYEVVNQYKSLVNPNCYIPEDIIYMTGISTAEIENAPTFRQIKDEVIEFFEDSYLVAHNARFDYSFIKNEFRRLSLAFSPRQICTVKLSKLLFPRFKKHNLDSLIERLNLVCENRHRAYDDTKVIWDFFENIQQTHPAEKISTLFGAILKTPSRPIGILPKTLDSLPEGPGVYIFYGDQEIPLYIGKSINIKERVLSHFASDHESSKEMKISQQIKRIEHQQTVGELGALLLESSLIKRMQPLYNRQLRMSRKLTTIVSRINDRGYQEIDLATLDQSDIAQVMGVFRSVKTAKQFLIEAAKQYDLCEKLLGLEKGKGACFGYRLGRCKGGCVGKEAAIKYNLRFLMAFSNSKLKSWPFSGPVLIEERDPFDEKAEGFLVDKWCFLGSVRDDADQIPLNGSFDYDTYKILERYLNSPKNQRNIKQISDKFLSQVSY